MQQLPSEVASLFERRLDRVRGAVVLRPDYLESARRYLEFCQRAGFPATAPTALGPFLTELAHLGHSIDQRQPYRLVASLLCECGLRLTECVNLRIHCFNLDAITQRLRLL